MASVRYFRAHAAARLVDNEGIFSHLAEHDEAGGDAYSAAEAVRCSKPTLTIVAGLSIITCEPGAHKSDHTPWNSTEGQTDPLPYVPSRMMRRKSRTSSVCLV